MPAKLRALCDYLDATDYPISGWMRLRPEGDALGAWFGPESDAWRALAGFGSGPDGSIMAFWLYDGREISAAPIVHLGSEGNALHILADNLDDFLRLFAIGYNELGFDDLSQPPDEPESAAGLRQWLESSFSVIPPEVGIDIVRYAQARHPDFESWVMRNVDIRDA
ncbi:hypothetical protein DPH57_17705 [Massilia sp. YMA4]|nr:hypothetical protein DPH57_17705 [Massilia sp. YMA4]